MTTIHLLEKIKIKVYVVTMYRHGNRESHSYVLGAWSDRKSAEVAGDVEEAWRGGKYKPEVTQWILDGNEYDNIQDIDGSPCPKCGCTNPYIDASDREYLICNGCNHSYPRSKKETV
jgi:hypothetical protein